VVVRSSELHSIIDRARNDGRLNLEPVDAEFIVRTQAAGLRHRRDGLAYRLTWRKGRRAPPKRVAPSSALPLRRKLVYRMRDAIAWQSLAVFRLARGLKMPRVYTSWARTMLRLYQSITWSRGRLGRLMDVVLRKVEA
jgi:hypothetical protein